MTIAALLHVPLFRPVGEGLQRGDTAEGKATQSGIILKLAARPAPIAPAIIAPEMPTSPSKALPAAQVEKLLADAAKKS